MGGMFSSTSCVLEGALESFCTRQLSTQESIVGLAYCCATMAFAAISVPLRTPGRSPTLQET